MPLEKPGIYNETRRAALLAYRALCYKTWNPHLGDKLEFELSNCTPEAAEEFRSLFSLNAILAARNKLEGILLQNDHSAISRNVRWIKRILKLTPCIACADAFVPYKGAADASAIASGQTVVTPEDYVTFTLYPDKDLGASVCIVTCFKGNERGEQFIDDLDPGNSSDDAAFNRIFNYALSMSLVYTSQAFWDFLSPEYKEEYVRLRMSRVSAPGGE
ncbi:MAG TPA: hypothetical protein VFV38_10290 [Ktedonobacteraceae bacterium]|nr:hypothetical protein [Ktedonobacteraceae bacterium]